MARKTRKPTTPLTPLVRLTNDATRAAPKPPPRPAYQRGDPERSRTERLMQWAYPAASGVVGTPAYDMRQTLLREWAASTPGSAPGIKGTPAYDLYNPPAPGGGGGGTQGAGGLPALASELLPLHEIQWQQAGFDVPGGNKPSWWRNLLPTNVSDIERPDVQYLAMLNTLLPYLSPEDQRNAAAQLYTTAADAFSAYKPENIGGVLPITPEEARESVSGAPVINERYFESTQRALEAIRALSNMREATVQGNRWKLGPGYTWLQQVLGTFEGFGAGPGRPAGAAGQPPIEPVGENRMTKAQYAGLLGALDPLLAQGQGPEIGAVGAIGRMLALPFFSQKSQRKTQAGQTINPWLFA